MHIAAFFSCVPTVVMGYHVWRLSSWSDVVLPCWLTVRHPFRSETEMPTSGRVPRILFLLLGQTMILLCRIHTQSARTLDCDEICRFLSWKSNPGFQSRCLVLYHSATVAYISRFHHNLESERMGCACASGMGVSKLSPGVENSLGPQH